MDKELQELNEKLLRFAGFEREKVLKHTSFPGDGYLWRWKYPDGCYYVRTPNFTTNLNAIDKWLFPELLKRNFYIGIGAEKSGWECWIFEGEPIEGDPFQEYEVKVLADTPVLAICKAIEQLIKEESCQKE